MPTPDFHIQVLPASRLSPSLRSEILALCQRAYEEDLGPLFETFHDAVHLLGWSAGRLVSHALWVTRFLQAGSGPLLRTAYVEAVATDPDQQRQGYASAIMQRLVEEIQDYDLAALSPFNVDYYARLGWELWRGPLFIRQEDLLLPSPEDEEVMIYRLPHTPRLDLQDSLSAEWREGELW
jgi:aminoglycoside 2'-N-acetyltransferase I